MNASAQETPSFYFVTEADIRDRAKHGKAPVGWADKQVELAREAGLLVTPRQLADLRTHRRFAVEDRARYVGPTRDEPTNDGPIITRQHGQVGTIIRTAGGVIAFQPDRMNSDEVVILEVREGTRSGFLLERVV